MASRPLIGEAIALTEKKVDMALDDIIKMSKNDKKGNKQRRASNKSQKFGGAKASVLNVNRYMDSRSAIRQGALAKRRSNFQENQFPVTTKAAQKAAIAPIHGSAFKANRVTRANKWRVGGKHGQRAATGVFTSKHENQRQQGNGRGGKQWNRSQTLDSLFANMKEMRNMKFSSQWKKNSNASGNGGRRRRAPLARPQFGN